MNIFKSFSKKKLYYITEQNSWSTWQDAFEVTTRLSRMYNLQSEILTDFTRIEKIKNSILHFGERNLFLPHKFDPDKSNRIIFTCYHGTDDETEYTSSYKDASERVDFVHTSTEITKIYLEKWGVDSKKIVVLPIGIDLNYFHSLNAIDKQEKKSRLGIPEDKFVIGSFQKDGNGWGEGNEPKLIKGPDVFCDVVERLNQKFPIFVLLTGPSRGYVKNRLDRAGIPYKHFYEKDPKNVWNYYNILDLYIVGSRAEGGPKALTESQASGVPIVTTRVGMAEDVIQQGENGFIAEVEDVDTLVKYSSMILNNSKLKEKLIAMGLNTVRRFDWDLVVPIYYEKLYSQLI